MKIVEVEWIDPTVDFHTSKTLTDIKNEIILPSRTVGYLVESRNDIVVICNTLGNIEPDRKGLQIETYFRETHYIPKVNVKKITVLRDE